MSVNPNEITGVILAGGKSKRMGVDKATLKIGRHHLIDYPLSVLSNIFENVFVVTNGTLIGKLRKILCQSYTGVRIMKDIIPNHGALGGIYTALHHADTRHVFVTACDMPFIKEDFIRFMLKKLDPVHDVLIPESPGGIETLHAFYKKTLIPVIKDFMLKDKNKIKDFFSDVNVCYLPWEDVVVFDSAGKMFRNINTPKELRDSRI